MQCAGCVQSLAPYEPLLCRLVFNDETYVLKQVDFHLHRIRLNAYYEYQLSPAAQEFIKHHTSLS